MLPPSLVLLSGRIRASLSVFSFPSSRYTFRFPKQYSFTPPSSSFQYRVSSTQLAFLGSGVRTASAVPMVKFSRIWNVNGTSEARRILPSSSAVAYFR